MNQFDKDSEFVHKLLTLVCEHGKENGYKAMKAIRIRWDKNKSVDGYTLEWHYPKEPKNKKVVTQ